MEDIVFAPSKVNRIPESGKVLFVDSRIPGFGIRNLAQGIRNPAKDSVESSIQVRLTRNPKSSTWNPESHRHKEKYCHKGYILLFPA